MVVVTLVDAGAAAHRGVEDAVVAIGPDQAERLRIFGGRFRRRPSSNRGVGVDDGRPLVEAAQRVSSDRLGRVRYLGVAFLGGNAVDGDFDDDWNVCTHGGDSTATLPV